MNDVRVLCIETYWETACADLAEQSNCLTFCETWCDDEHVRTKDAASEYPHVGVWICAGHCAGLRVTQNLGDYVLAHAYVREDHVLDQVRSIINHTHSDVQSFHIPLDFPSVNQRFHKKSCTCWQNV